MKKLALIFAIFSLFFTASHALALGLGSDDNRYFIQNTKGFWKNTFGVRNSFDDGFTSDLSDWQLRIARLAGVKVIPVRKLNILPAEANAAAKHTTPTEKVPWNVAILYHATPEKTSGGSSVNVAVLDTGVYVDHSDLKDRIKECKDFTSSKDAVVDDKCDDRNGHGTHIAGIIAADGGSDGKGLYGVAPEAGIYAYKVCAQNGSCWADDIANAIRTATDDGAQIINISLGSDTSSSLIDDAVQYAVDNDVLVVAAAGNDGPYSGSIDYPAANPQVVSVAAVDASLDTPDWSSRGTNEDSESFVRDEKDIEFAMPGVNIESTWKDGSYVILSGTSMAAPHLAGLAAKVWQSDSLHPAQATRKLLHTLSHDLAPVGDDNATGWGIPTL